MFLELVKGADFSLNTIVPGLEEPALPVHSHDIFLDWSGIGQGYPLRYIMSAVLVGIIQLTSQHIRIPYTPSEEASIKAQFAATSGFLSVIRALDYTRAASQIFVIRKQFNSVPEQVRNARLRGETSQRLGF